MSTAPPASIELEDFNRARTMAQTNAGSLSDLGIHDANPEVNGVVIQQLRPADGGLAAWRVLIAASVFEALLWGFPICFGVFQNYYSTLPQFAGNVNIALIGTVAQGLYYLGAPFSAALTKRFAKYQRQQIWVAWADHSRYIGVERSGAAIEEAEEKGNS